MHRCEGSPFSRDPQNLMTRATSVVTTSSGSNDRSRSTQTRCLVPSASGVSSRAVRSMTAVRASTLSTLACHQGGALHRRRTRGPSVAVRGRREAAGQPQEGTGIQGAAHLSWRRRPRRKPPRGAERRARRGPGPKWNSSSFLERKDWPRYTVYIFYYRNTMCTYTVRTAGRDKVIRTKVHLRSVDPKPLSVRTSPSGFQRPIASQHGFVGVFIANGPIKSSRTTSSTRRSRMRSVSRDMRQRHLHASRRRQNSPVADYGSPKGYFLG